MKENPQLSEPIQQALNELQRMISQRIPTATFAVRRGIDDPAQAFLVTTVDIEDPDEVMDVVLERLLELKLDQGIPVNVLPVHTPERIAETRRQIASRLGSREMAADSPLRPK